MLFLDHPALDIISCTEIPAIAAAEEEAPLVEWGLNISLMPLSANTSLIHLAIVDEVTALDGPLK